MKISRMFLVNDTINPINEDMQDVTVNDICTMDPICEDKQDVTVNDTVGPISEDKLNVTVIYTY